MSIQKICAGFETTLAAKLFAAGTSFSLSSHLTKKGVELSGEYGFILGEGTAVEEWCYGTVVNGLVTIIKRGLDPEDPNTEVTALKFDHDRGSSVKITDYPFLGFLREYLAGSTPLPAPLKYITPQTPTEDSELIDKKYADDLFTGAIGTASNTTAGGIKTDKATNGKPRSYQTLVQEQATPDMTLKVLPFKHAEVDRNISFAGGNSPTFISPSFSGDLSLQTNPSNAETFVITINGTVCTFTFVTSIGATPGNVLIGASAAATRANLAALINAPSVTTANGVAFTGAQLTALGLISAADDLATTIFIKSISSTLTALSATETMAGANNTWTINTTKNRIDLLVLQTSDSTLQIRRGFEAVTPVAINPNSGDIVLAQVYLKIGMTHIDDVSDGTNGYIVTWYFPSVYNTNIVSLDNSGKISLDKIYYYFGDGSDGDVTISINTSLNRDMYYNNLIILPGIILNPNGYRIYVKEILSGGGVISRNGNNGGVGGDSTVSVAGTAGAAGAALAAGTIAGGLAGGSGGVEAGEGGSGVAGVASNSICNQPGVAGGHGGKGSNTGYSGGAGGSAGAATNENSFISFTDKLLITAETLNAINSHPKISLAQFLTLKGSLSGFSLSSCASSGGGGSGATGGGTGISKGAGGGGAGGNAGIVFISAKTITNIIFEAKGGNGGNGGNSAPASYTGGVGGGGAGGCGGLVVLIYITLSGETITVTGGSAGSAGTIGNTTNATPGSAGNVGKYIKIALT